jgi:hypothetical protein
MDDIFGTHSGGTVYSTGGAAAAWSTTAWGSALALGDLFGELRGDLEQVADAPKSAISKIGASGSLFTATIVFEVCIPARCWMAPEMPRAM